MSTTPDTGPLLASSPPLHPLRIKQVLNLLGHEDVLQREVLVVNAAYRETLAAAPHGAIKSMNDLYRRAWSKQQRVQDGDTRD